MISSEYIGYLLDSKGYGGNWEGHGIDREEYRRCLTTSRDAYIIDTINEAEYLLDKGFIKEINDANLIGLFMYTVLKIEDPNYNIIQQLYNPNLNDNYKSLFWKADLEEDDEILLEFED